MSTFLQQTGDPVGESSPSIASPQPSGNRVSLPNFPPAMFPASSELLPGRGLDVHLAPEARLLYALLDAADVDGLLTEPGLAQAWSTAREHGLCSRYEAGVADFMVLLLELERRGLLANSWIGTRWSTIRRRILAPRDVQLARRQT